jgi:hypothetical protein
MERRRPGGSVPEPAWLNIGCGTHNAAPPWWNTDVVENDVTHPDEVVPRGYPLPYPADSCERVMLSHCMEHVPWQAINGGQSPLLELLAECRRLLVPGGRLLAIGPDYRRTLRMWREGRATDDLLFSVLEHANGPVDLIGDWPEARHHWNCDEARMVTALQVAGFANVEPLSVPMEASRLFGDGWPIVGPAEWQCMAAAEAPPA